MHTKIKREMGGVPRTLVVCITMVLLGGVIVPAVRGEVLQGRVIAVRDTTVDVRLDGERMPALGDRVTISYMVPGMGTVPVQGTWSVAQLGTGRITAEAVGPASQPQEGQLVTIVSAQLNDPAPTQELDADREEIQRLFERGQDFHYGRDDTPQDYAQALHYYRQAAERGYAPAQNGMGLLYTEGKGVDPNFVEAVTWFRRAAEQGDVQAQSNLGNKYYLGHGVDQNDVEALAWYRKAADQGYAQAQVSVGRMYEKGRGVPQDWTQVAAWYRQAAAQGYAQGAFNLGTIYAQGQGVPQDEAQAVTWFRQAAEQGHVEAQFVLATRYEAGQGVAPNRDEALRWYRAAATQGHVEAQAAFVRLVPAPTVEIPNSMVTPPVPAPVAPPVPAQPTLPIPPTAPTLSAGDRALQEALQSGEGARIRDAGKLLYRGRYTSKTLLDTAAEVLERGYNQETDRYYPDAMAWLCKALGQSKQKKYGPLLDTVATEATSTRLRGHAQKSAQLLNR